ncbi:MAG: hypothetical protein KDJ35_00750 [Alphaproteobacteria bacterium]|nr:hypothetical protein [Alphaproteobacteria bacterium]
MVQHSFKKEVSGEIATAEQLSKRFSQEIEGFLHNTGQIIYSSNAGLLNVEIHRWGGDNALSAEQISTQISERLSKVFNQESVFMHMVNDNNKIRILFEKPFQTQELN